jgi:hypothetical protein
MMSNIQTLFATRVPTLLPAFQNSSIAGTSVVLGLKVSLLVSVFNGFRNYMPSKPETARCEKVPGSMGRVRVLVYISMYSGSVLSLGILS